MGHWGFEESEGVAFPETCKNFPEMKEWLNRHWDSNLNGTLENFIWRDNVIKSQRTPEARSGAGPKPQPRPVWLWVNVSYTSQIRENVC